MKKTYGLATLCIILVLSYMSVTAFTKCPGEEDYVNGLIYMIDDYVDNVRAKGANDPISMESLFKIIDVISFYDTHELSEADCSEEGDKSGEPIYTGTTGVVFFLAI